MKYTDIQSGEQFVGNILTGRDMSYMEDVRYRIGDQALDIHGKKIDPEIMRPLYIDAKDGQKYDHIKMRSFREISRKHNYLKEELC